MPKMNRKNMTVDHAEAEWKLNSLVLCRYLHTPGEVYYEAKIINILKDANGGFVYKVHYQGWNSRHDEKITQEDAKIRFRVHTAEAAVQAKETLNALQQSAPKSKKVKKLSSEDVERSTPSPSVDPYKKVYRTSVSGSQRQLTANEEAQRSLSSTQPKKRSESREASMATPHRSASQMGNHHANNAKKRRLSKENGGVGPAAKKPDSELTFQCVLLEKDMGNILKLDNYLVKEQFFIPNLPATFTIATIMEEYRQFLENEVPSSTTTAEDEVPPSGGSADELPSFTDRELSANVEFIMGIMDFFDALLESRFLYDFERDRHEEYVRSLKRKVKKMGAEAAPTLGMSHHYGLPHLLRLLVKLPETLASANIPCTQVTVEIMKYRTDRLMTFLNDNWQRYFTGENDYQPASLTYMSQQEKKKAERLANKSSTPKANTNAAISLKSAMGAIAHLGAENAAHKEAGSEKNGGESEAENKENEFGEAKIPTIPMTQC